MATSPGSTADHNSVDFRAPPPSPIASGRRSSFNNDDVLSDFLENSLQVPDLVLPDRVFPRHKSIQNPPKIDLRILNPPENSTVAEILESVAQIGCFQLVNHGIERELISSVLTAGAGIFSLPPEKKAVVSRTPEKLYGFEELHGEGDREIGEEFVWCGDQGLKLEMEGIWPLGYSKFSDKLGRLSRDLEKVAGEVLSTLKENTTITTLRESVLRGNGNTVQEGQELAAGSVCYLYKNCCNIPLDQWVGAMRYEVMRMLIRGPDYSHALCLHVCDGSSEFNVYSKKGWISFCPDTDAVVVTIGDQIQAWSGGHYKYVMGRPIFKGEEAEECISMAFLYSPTTTSTSTSNGFKTKRETKTISLGQQAIVAILLTLIYIFWSNMD